MRTSAGKKQSSGGRHGGQACVTMALICCVTENKGPGAAEHEPRCGFSGWLQAESSGGFAVVLPFISFLLSPLVNIP